VIDEHGRDELAASLPFPEASLSSVLLPSASIGGAIEHDGDRLWCAAHKQARFAAQKTHADPFARL
jgi:hypothetical protein